MCEGKLRVAVIGCGRMGQIYAEAYSTYPDTEIVAIAEHNPDRLQVVGERFGVAARYRDADALLKDVERGRLRTAKPQLYQLFNLSARLKLTLNKIQLRAHVHELEIAQSSLRGHGKLSGTQVLHARVPIRFRAPGRGGDSSPQIDLIAGGKTKVI